MDRFLEADFHRGCGSPLSLQMNYQGVLDGVISRCRGSTINLSEYCKRTQKDKRAGLDCGQCRTVLTDGRYGKNKQIEVSCKDRPVCEHFYLHLYPHELPKGM